LSYTFWFALQLLLPGRAIVINSTQRKFTWSILVLVFIQLIYGALMAGHKAATAAPTWPDINGTFIPPNMLAGPDGLLNILENKITIHFIHRTVAYLILALIIVWTISVYRIKGSSFFNKVRPLPLTIVSLQVLLGILSVVASIHIVPNHWGVFEWMAQLHQLVAMLLLLSLVLMLYVVRNKQTGNT